MKNLFLHSTLLAVLILSAFAQQGLAEEANSTETSPRIVNIYNFIRNTDYRVHNSEEHLYNATRRQVELFAKYKLPVTWALQYDALINPKYQELLKEHIGPDDEIGVWWELPRQLVEKAGIKWRGDHDWVSTANIAFSPGYTPEERIKLVDTYMADFKNIFGRYPKSAGSWYIDEVTLAHMADHYGIIASCNCKDQIGTDGYTLWGGYWNQAYYPSRLNSYMPAQTKAGQIDIPIFRMLGSDPIYQYGNPGAIYSLEPVYGESGGSSEWVEWLFSCMVQQPCLAFGYTQAGQENSFGWNSMGRGLEAQAPLLAKLRQSGDIRVETLSQSGEWYRKKFPLTPATCIVCLEDWKKEGHKSVWYNSRFYRTNLFWDEGGISIRDIHRFDESRTSVTHDVALTETTLAYKTLPIVEGIRSAAGAFPMQQSEAGRYIRLSSTRQPIVSQKDDSGLTISQELQNGGTLTVTCEESQVSLSLASDKEKANEWALDIRNQEYVPESVTKSAATYQSQSGTYQLKLAPEQGCFELLKDGSLRVHSNPEGLITLILGDSE